MAQKERKICVQKNLITSKAYRSLRTPTAYFVLGIFWTKRQMAKVGRKSRDDWVIANNGEIVFTYEEAEARYGISSGAFRSAIDELRNKGFLDIAKSGAGLYKSASLYTISDRWRAYGTAEYKQPKPRPPNNKGFRKGNRYGRNCRKEKKSTVTG